MIPEGESASDWARDVWVSVDEGWPRPNQLVLLMVPPRIALGWHTGPDPLEPGNEGVWVERYHGTVEPTHWMHTPEAPKP